MRFERAIAVDPFTLELGQPRLREHFQRRIAQRAIVALEQDKTHGAGTGTGMEA